MNPTALCLSVVSLMLVAATVSTGEPLADGEGAATDLVTLPAPRLSGELSLEAALAERRSVRHFTDRPLSLAVVGQVLWAAQGVTHPEGRRTAPSAGATYPLEVYLVAGAVEGLPAGVYRYRCRDHRLEPVSQGDVRADLTAAALNQAWMRGAPASIVVAAVGARTAARYGQRAGRYVAMEVGAAMENMQVQGVALGLGSTFVGAFDDGRVKEVLGLLPQEEPMALLPLGYPGRR